MKNIKKILFIRRDNIGDLVCTTPAIKAIKEWNPEVKIGVLVNSYNADVIEGNTDIDETFVYTKAKHVRTNPILVFAKNFIVLWQLRKKKYDVAIGCGYSPGNRVAKYALLSGAKLRIGYSVTAGLLKRFYYNVAVEKSDDPIHEVESVFNLLKPLGVNTNPGKMIVEVLPGEKEEASRKLQLKGSDPLIAFHISSRRPENRWPSKCFVELGDKLIEKYGIQVLLLWSPGDENNPYHPGDDRKVNTIKNLMNNKPLIFKTDTLRDLVAALSLTSMVICSDGGAMHIAAALGKPIVTIWGSTSKKRWSPWSIEHRILQRDSKADATTVVDVIEAIESIWAGKTGHSYKNYEAVDRF